MAAGRPHNPVIRAVLFDLDGTLFDRDFVVRGLGDTQYSAFERELAHVSQEQFVSRLVELDAHGLGDKEMVYQRLERELDLPVTLSQRLLLDFWARYHSFCRPFSDVVSTLEELRSRGKKLGLVTNGRETIQNRTIDALGIRHLLDAILISEVEGVRKPSRTMFERAVERLGVNAFECCHVGDHPDTDVAGARAAGLSAVWKRVPYWSRPPEPVPIIDTLTQVLEYA